MNESSVQVYVPDVSFLIRLGESGLSLLLQRFPELFKSFGIADTKNAVVTENLQKFLPELKRRAEDAADRSAAATLCAVLEDIEVLVAVFERSTKTKKSILLREFGEENKIPKGKKYTSVLLAVVVCLMPQLTQETRWTIACARASEKMSGADLAFKSYRMVYDGYDEDAEKAWGYSLCPHGLEAAKEYLMERVFSAFSRRGIGPSWFLYDDELSKAAGSTADKARFLQVYLHPASTGRRAIFVIEHGGWKEFKAVKGETEAGSTVERSAPRVRDVLEINFEERLLRVRAAEPWMGQYLAAKALSLATNCPFRVYPHDHLISDIRHPYKITAENNIIPLLNSEPQCPYETLCLQRDRHFVEEIVLRDDGLPVCRLSARMEAQNDNIAFWRDVGEVLKLGAISRNRLYGEYAPKVAYFIDLFLEGEPKDVSFENRWYDPRGNEWSLLHVGDEHYPYIPSEREHAISLPAVHPDEVRRLRIKVTDLAKYMVAAIAPMTRDESFKNDAGSGAYRIGYKNDHLYCLLFEGIVEDGMPQGCLTRLVSHYKISRAGVLSVFTLSSPEGPDACSLIERHIVQTSLVSNYLSFDEETGLTQEQGLEGLWLVPWPLREAPKQWPGVDDDLFFKEVQFSYDLDEVVIQVRGGEPYRCNINELPMFEPKKGDLCEERVILKHFKAFQQAMERAAEDEIRAPYGVTFDDAGITSEQMTEIIVAFKDFFPTSVDSVIEEIPRPARGWGKLKDETTGELLFPDNGKKHRYKWAMQVRSSFVRCVETTHDNEFLLLKEGYETPSYGRKKSPHKSDADYDPQDKFWS